MAVTVSGMFGHDKTYFADSPVVIDINGLEWPVSTPFSVVRVEVIRTYDGAVVGKFRAEAGRQSSISFDISTALRAMLIEDFRDEVSDAQTAVEGRMAEAWVRAYKPYSLVIYTEYISEDGVFEQTQSPVISGGRCAIGGLTEWERKKAIDDLGDKANADVSYREHRNLRNGDASTKPVSSPERVGSSSITSWVDVQNAGTQSIFYPAITEMEDDSVDPHAPIVLRDSLPYADFLFVNRRGAVETCSALMLESMGIEVDVQQYARVERPSFQPSRSLMAISKGGRRSWAMSSGAQTREWAEWWVLEFLMSRRWWMLYRGEYVPVVVEPDKKESGIYDRSKQQMPHVDFTVTLALEG